MVAGQVVGGDTLRTVEVVGYRPAPKAQQVLSGEELKRLSTHSVADAMRYFGGVEIKDYGGVGGIKTVNVRAMGASHVGISYDGIALGNAQNGQIDLGQFGLDNIEEITLSNGRQPRLLQPAKEYGAAAQVSLQTRKPQFRKGEKPWRLRGQVSSGSFDYIGGGVALEGRMSQRVNCSLNVNAVNASGRYKFRLKQPGYDTTAVRHNGDIFATRLEANLFGSLPTGSWTAKAYTFYSNRGIPGAIVANVWRRGERLKDSNSFAQGSYRGSWGRWQLLCNAKYAYYDTHYWNHDAHSLQVDRRYRQHEGFVSAAGQYNVLHNWSFNLSYDLQVNEMKSDLAGFDGALRWTNFLAAGSEFSVKGWTFQGAVLGTFVNDKSSRNRAVTPSFSVNYSPIPCLQFRTMAKESFRMPTFNDLYYTDAASPALRPERVRQIDLGAVYEHRFEAYVESVRVSADAFYNRVTDKIIAYPRGQQFRWTMMNLGEVDIRGLETTARITLCPAKDWQLSLRGQYTLQRAIDITDPEDSYYRNQIPYTPRHSGSATAAVRWRTFQLNYSFIYVGQRWNQQENIRRNFMPSWQTSDLSVTADWRNYRIQLEVNNLLNEHYAVIVNYPMPGLNFRATFSVEF